MKVSTTVRQEVVLDGDAVNDVFKKRLDDLCGGEDIYLNGDGWLEEWEDTGHGSGITHQRGRPTPVQKAALKLRDALRDERISMESKKKYEAARGKRRTG